MLNRINRFDRRNLTMALLGRLLVARRDSDPWLHYDFGTIINLLCKKRRVRALWAPRKDRGLQKKKFEDHSRLQDERIIRDDLECLADGSISSSGTLCSSCSSSSQSSLSE